MLEVEGSVLPGCPVGSTLARTSLELLGQPVHVENIRISRASLAAGFIFDDLHDDDVDLLFPHQCPEISKSRIQRSLRRDIPLRSTLRLYEVCVDIVGTIVVTLLLESNTREIIRPDILVPGMRSIKLKLARHPSET